MSDNLNSNKSCSYENNIQEIDKELRSTANDILSEELKEDNSITILKHNEIFNSVNLKNIDAADEKWLQEYAKKLFLASSPTILEYHKSEIENVNNIINCMLSTIKVISYSTLVLVALFSFFDKDVGAIISLVSGGFIDTVLSILTGLFNSTLKSKKSYFDAENDSSKFDKMLFLVQIISNEKEKDSIIVDILRKYFNISSDKTAK